MKVDWSHFVWFSSGSRFTRHQCRSGRLAAAGLLRQRLQPTGGGCGWILESNFESTSYSLLTPSAPAHLHHRDPPTRKRSTPETRPPALSAPARGRHGIAAVQEPAASRPPAATRLSSAVHRAPAATAASRTRIRLDSTSIRPPTGSNRNAVHRRPPGPILLQVHAVLLAGGRRHAGHQRDGVPGRLLRLPAAATAAHAGRSKLLAVHLVSGFCSGPGPHLSPRSTPLISNHHRAVPA